MFLDVGGTGVCRGWRCRWENFDIFHLDKRLVRGGWLGEGGAFRKKVDEDGADGNG